MSDVTEAETGLIRGRVPVWTGVSSVAIDIVSFHNVEAALDERTAEDNAYGNDEVHLVPAGITRMLLGLSTGIGLHECDESNVYTGVIYFGSV